MKTRARKDWKVFSGTICQSSVEKIFGLHSRLVRYSYHLVGKGRWNSLTLKKQKTKGPGKKASKMNGSNIGHDGDADDDDEKRDKVRTST
jgi:hypothetical protein